MNDDQLPRFERPPVIEAVLGVQFGRIAGFSAAHAGRFWAQSLPQPWEKVREAPRIDDFREHFGPERQLARRGLRLTEGVEPNRIQLITSDRMLQVQDSRLIYNWIKTSDSDKYPTYSELLPAFLSHWEAFQRFASESGLGALDPNQWEVTYVNHVPRGALWESPEDWPLIVKDAWLPPSRVSTMRFDGMQTEWRFVLDKEVGRLRMSLQHGRSEGGKGGEVLSLQLVARGPVDADHELLAGMNEGHRSIVTCFAEMTSERAHAAWGRTR